MSVLQRPSLLHNASSAKLFLICDQKFSHGVFLSSQQSITHRTLSPTRRYASTATTVISTSNSNVNPPTSTLPPLLQVPDRTPDQSTPGYYFSLGKAYLSFYKTGLKAVWSNYQSSQTLIKSVPQGLSVYDAVRRNNLSRADFQLIRRAREDVKKIPLFALVFLICGEFTPLVVVFMTGVVPKTCRIPKQVEGERQKMEERRALSFRNGTVNAVHELPLSQKTEALLPEQVVHFGRSLGLYGKMWDRIGGAPQALLRRRVQKWKEYIEVDDAAIQRCGGVDKMSIEEVKIACEDRGLDILGRNDEKLRGVLKAWLANAKNEDITRLVLMRPSVWKKKA